MDFSKWGPLTVLIVGLVLLCTTSGVVVTIIKPETLSFDQFLNDVSKFVFGLAGLALAHGVFKK